MHPLQRGIAALCRQQDLLGWDYKGCQVGTGGQAEVANRTVTTFRSQQPTAGRGINTVDGASSDFPQERDPLEQDAQSRCCLLDRLAPETPP